MTDADRVATGHGYAVGIDIGGTFTDCVAVRDDGRIYTSKTLSTHSTSPVEGLVRGLELLAAEAGIGYRDLLAGADRVSHGTTIGTNLVVERKGADVALLATRGHGDALAMMRGNGRTAGVPVDRVFSVHETDKPKPLVPRARVAEIVERHAADGTVLTPLDEVQARAAIESLLAQGDVDAIAIALIWGFRHPAHERRLRELVEELAPGVFVSISSDTSPRQGEYERTVSTVVNSYVGPASSAYLGDFETAMADGGLRRPPFIMQANGGVVPVAEARRLPLQTIGSGPAGGLAGAAAIAAANGHDNVIATDMGGTSFETGLLIGGRPVTSDEEVIDQYAFHTSRLDLRSIACGGGSIATVDATGRALQVGPESAGSDPGPACYGKGELPTVTDADVVLGLIDADGFLGGTMKLDRAAAERAIEPLAERLGLSVAETAAGILQINAHQAATLIRQRTVEQGLDPREFALYSFGGAGPVHAFAYARELGVDTVLIPLGNGASTLSAYGIASSEVVRSFEGECAIPEPFDRAAVAAAVEPVERRAVEALAESGFAAEDVVLERSLVIRYAEQLQQSLSLTLPDGPVDDAAVAALPGRFAEAYARLFGEAALTAFQAVEAFSVRVTARVELESAPLPSGDGDRDERPATPAGEREVHWPGAGPAATAVYDGAALELGEVVAGPAVVALPHTSVSVAAGQSLRRDVVGNLILSV